MKNKIGYVIIGILLGAIITTSIFFVQIKKMKEENTINEDQKIMQRQNREIEEPPDMPEEDRKEPPENNPTLDRQSNEKMPTENKI